MNDSKIYKLNYLLEKIKFSDSEWEKRGLNPSSPEICEYLEKNLNVCLLNLLEEIKEKDSKNQLKKILKSELQKIDKKFLDTEEKEFVCDYFNEISKILEIDFKNDLNNWLYNPIFNNLLKTINFFKRENKNIEVLSQNCSKCNSKLETFILEKDDKIDESFYFIVKCKSCQEYNLVNDIKNIRKINFGNYDLIEQLSSKEFNLEEAKIRLKQIQYFRK